MEKNILIITTAVILSIGITNAQEIAPSAVPSVVLNKFKQSFVNATDVEWEKKGDRYEVEFELDTKFDHEIWYTEEGRMVSYKQEIAASELPKAVLSSIEADFAGYKIDDVDKIEEGDATIYVVELESLTQDWKVVINEKGKLLSKVAD